MSSKTKISQHDLRKYMSLHKKKLLESTKKVESPLAKYLSDGTLKCILCDSAIKNEMIWRVHINSKQHKDNIAKKKQVSANDEEDHNFISPDVVKNGKRTLVQPQPAVHPVPPKKLKGILKNAPPVPTFDGRGKDEEEMSVESVEIKTEASSPPPAVLSDQESSDVEMKTASGPVHQETDLPEGFFDNPLLDAKARKVEYKDPVEEEWERFQKEMKEETTLSAQIIQEESEVATAERQFVEVDEQLKNWSRVLDLEIKKENLHQIVSMANDVKKEDINSSEEVEDDIEEYVNWRTKKSFR